MSEDTQEPRKDTVAAAVTATEKWQLQLVARKEGRPLSDLIRENALDDLIERGRKIQGLIEAMDADSALAS